MRNLKRTIIIAVSLTACIGSFAGIALAQTTGSTGQYQGRGPGGGHMPGVFGTVQSVSGTTITVESKGFGQSATQTTYTVDASGATVTKNNAAASISDIATGDTIMVQGAVSGTSVTATSIRDGLPQRPQGQGAQGENGGGQWHGATSSQTHTTQQATPPDGSQNDSSQDIAQPQDTSVGSPTALPGQDSSGFGDVSASSTPPDQGFFSSIVSSISGFFHSIFAW